MPVALAAFFATRFSFAPVLRTTPFADLLVFFDEVPDFLRLAFFMDFLPFAISFSLAHSTFSGKNRCVAFLRGQLIETGPRERGSRSVSLASDPASDGQHDKPHLRAGRLPWRGSRNSYARYGSGR
jgi:hypothetical protein